MKKESRNFGNRANFCVKICLLSFVACICAFTPSPPIFSRVYNYICIRNSFSSPARREYLALRDTTTPRFLEFETCVHYVHFCYTMLTRCFTTFTRFKRPPILSRISSSPARKRCRTKGKHALVSRTT